MNNKRLVLTRFHEISPDFIIAGYVQVELESDRDLEEHQRSELLEFKMKSRKDEGSHEFLTRFNHESLQWLADELCYD